MFKIATTETYDPTLCIDEWVKRDKEFDFLLYITKVLTPRIIRILTDEQSPWAWMNKPSVLHLTVTGWGDTDLEPNVIDCDSILYRMGQLISKGYPKERIVLRIDPIIPTDNGMGSFSAIVSKGLNYGITRYRSSVMQLYQHSAERLQKTSEWNEINRVYKRKFMPSNNDLESIGFFEKIKYVVEAAKRSATNIHNIGNITFESCATKLLTDCGFENIGCMSERDLLINGLNPDDLDIPKGHQRTSCMCLMKHQLIPGGYKRGRCPHQCAYCYLKDSPEQKNAVKSNELF